ncbi:MAG: molybdopterin-containing oxidoreductase family protein [Bacteroidia bacterium]
MKFNRRDFIKISSLGLGSAFLANTIFDSATGSILATDVAKGHEFLKTPTYCEVCFWKCAAWVHKNENGEIWKLEGHKDDPHCNGRLCPRGTGGIGMYEDQDRLKKPLMRVVKNGKQTYEEVSWETALDFIAKKMNDIKEKYGPESMALLTHGSGSKFLGHLMKAYGSPHIAAPSFAQCRGPREVAFISTFGEGIYSPERTDIRDTKCLVLIGSHIGENMHNGQVQEMSEAIDKGATIITVDPRFSTAASKSKHWLPIKPATDLALLLAWTHVIINEGWYDKEYIEKYAFGFDELKAHVQQYTPEWAYGITTIKPDVIRETAREMAAASPAAIIHPGRHVTWYGDDTQRLRAVAILNALLGSWGRRGGFYFPEKISVPSYPHPEYPKPKHKWQSANPNKYTLATEVVSNGIVDATFPSDERDYSIKGWIVNGTNLMQTLPDQKRTLEAIQQLELMVVIDTMPMEITGYADIVLPECTYLERYDGIRNSPHREPVLSLRMPAAKPKYETKPDWWIAKQIGEKLGLQDFFKYKDIEEMLDWQLKKVGTSLKEMQKVGVKKFKREYDDLYLVDGQDFEFNTSTGKIELYATDLAAQGFDPLPTFTEHKQPPQGFYRLNYGRSPVHTFSRTTNNPYLASLKDENDLWVNPKVAKQWGFTNGQEVWLKNQDDIVSTFSIKIRITERIRWDSVYMYHGFGHTEKQLTRAFGKGASDTEMMSNVKMDPIMGGTGMRENFITFLTEKPEPKQAEI